MSKQSEQNPAEVGQLYLMLAAEQPEMTSAEDISAMQSELRVQNSSDFDETDGKKKEKIRFSIETIEGTNYKYVQADRKVFKGNSEKEWSENARSYLQKMIAENNGRPISIPVTSRNGKGTEYVEIDDTTAWKITDRKIRNKKGEIIRELTKKEYDVKTNAILHLDELVEVSKYSRQSADYKERHNFIDGFTYRTAFFRDYDGGYYRLVFSVKDSGISHSVYNIGEQRERTFTLNPGSSDIAISAQSENPSAVIIRNSAQKSQEVFEKNM